MLPVLASLGERAKLLADERQIVAGVRIRGVEADGLAEMAASVFSLAEFVQDGAEIRVGQRVFRRCLGRAGKEFESLFKIALLVIERPAIQQRFDFCRLETQRLLVSIDRFAPAGTTCLQGECTGEPIVGGEGDRNCADFFFELARFEIEDELAGKRLEAGAAALDNDVATIGKDAELR